MPNSPVHDIQAAAQRLPVYALCGGPAQAVFLRATLESLGISPRQCHVILAVQQFGSDVASPTQRLCEAMGMTPAAMPTGSEWGDALHTGRRAGVLLLSRGIACDNKILRLLMHFKPSRVVEYYDGYRSYVVARESRTCHLASSPRGPVTHLRVLLARAAKSADVYAMPDDGIWARYAHTTLRERLLPLGAESVERAIDGIGQLSGSAVEPVEMVCLANLYSERRPGVKAADELRMYDAMLAAARQARPDATLTIKPHPRTDPAKLDALDTIAKNHGGNVRAGSQLIEYDLLHTKATTPVIFGGPCTAFLNSRWLNCAQSLCATYNFTRSYLGDSYGHMTWAREDHELMTESGIESFDTTAALTEAIRRKVDL